MKEMMDKVVITVSVTGSFGDRSVRQVLLLALFPQRRIPLGSPQGQHFPHPKTYWACIKIANRDLLIRWRSLNFDFLGISKYLLKTGKIKPSPFFQICMGVNWGVPASPYPMFIMKQAFPPGL